MVVIFSYVPDELFLVFLFLFIRIGVLSPSPELSIKAVWYPMTNEHEFQAMGD